MDFSSLICDLFKILFPVPYHSFHVTGNVFRRTILREVEEEEMYVTSLLEEKCLQQVNLCYRHEEKMAAINNIEIFGSVCRETNPSHLNSYCLLAQFFQQVFNF
jgi:hypothetical protein